MPCTPLRWSLGYEASQYGYQRLPQGGKGVRRLWPTPRKLCGPITNGRKRSTEEYPLLDVTNYLEVNYLRAAGDALAK